MVLDFLDFLEILEINPFHPMKRNLAILALAVVAVCGRAQILRDGYVDWGNGSPEFFDNLSTWSSTYQLTADDNFFVSRVKPKARFRNVSTQVMTTLTDANDKRLLAWLPWEDSNMRGFNHSALPTGFYDTEIFSMWSYVDHWGVFNAPLGRIPGGLLDVAHKNGVAVSGTAGIPNPCAIESHATWKVLYAGFAESKAANAAKMLYYYGNDGLGYNSEFSGSASGQQRVIAFHKALIKNLKTLGNPNAENIWYDGTNDNGGNTFDSALSGYQGLYGTDAEPVMSVFGNYNSMIAGKQSSVITNAAGYGRSSLYYYSGLNMQGGDPSTNWSVIKDYATSIGLWGAHTSNMFFQQRYQNGAAPATQQRTYLLSTERWFGGGYRNPVLHQTPYSNVSYSFNNIDKNPGMCSMMTARSTLQWDLSEEPFVTFFNLGNGTFLNWKGERKNSNDWGNVGVQDYLPTWRFWFSTAAHSKAAIANARTASNATTGWDAQFTWDDAYVGGSCLELTGAQGQGTAYLALFKTQFDLQSGDQITLRYKVTEGLLDEMKLNLYNHSSGAEESLACASSQHHDSDLWVEKTFTLAGALHCDLIELTLNASTEGAKVLLGELSIKRGTSATPAAPTSLTSSVLYDASTGSDVKLIWEMPGKKALPTPTFNLDVNTSMFRMWAQVDEEEPVLMGLTTSWAGIIYRTPNVGTRVRYGVSAVSTDFDSESDITWTAWQNISALDHTYDDAIQIDKTTIKPGEEFTISYADPRHEAATSWKIVNRSGTAVATGSGKSITTSIATTGLYDVVITGTTHKEGATQTNETTTYAAYVAVSDESTGAVPQVKTLTADGKTDAISIEVNQSLDLAFTARNSDGATSRGIELDSKFFGTKLTDFGIKGGTYASQPATSSNTSSFSVSYWVKLNKLVDRQGYLKIVNPTSSTWPRNNWGTVYADVYNTETFPPYFYFTWQTGTQDSYQSSGSKKSAGGGIFLCYTGSSQPKLLEGQWTHICVTFDWASASYYRYGGTSTSTTKSTGWSLKPKLYVNGVRLYPDVVKIGNVEQTRNFKSSASNDTYDRYNGLCAPETAEYLFVGGPDRIGPIDGIIDHYAVWNKALTADEVVASMGDFSSVPSGLVGLYTFDNDINADGTYSPAMGSGPKVGLYATTYPDGAEGAAVFSTVEPTLTTGNPLLSGATEVKTTATWNAPGADITAQAISNTTSASAKQTPIAVRATGTDLTGTATVSWPMEGQRDVSVTLTNAYGSDTKTITAVQITDPLTAIDAIADGRDEVEIIPAQETVYVRVPADGEYRFTIYGTDGRIRAHRYARLSAGQSIFFSLPHQGVYLLSVEKDGQALKSLKFLRD